MKSALPAATAAQKWRFEVIKREVGCIACLLDGFPGTPADAHHLLDPQTGNKISHSHTIPLCPFQHHRKGPLSIHQGKRAFAQKYGTDEALLAITDQYVEQFKANTVGGAF